MAVPMTTQNILETLLKVERALRSRDCLAAHELVFQAQERLLELERELIAMQAEKLRLTADAPEVEVPAALLANWSVCAYALAGDDEPAGDRTEELLHALAQA